VTPRWSVVIPAYNEAHRLPRFLDTVVTYLEGRDEPYEVIVVDDASTDQTSEIVAARRVSTVTVLRRDRNGGKGVAVRAGMLSAKGAYRLFADADGATPIEELKRLEPALVAGADVVIGSRALRDPGVALVARRHRMAAGCVFNWLVARAGLEGVSDSQCGFKAFTARAAGHLFQTLSTPGLAFDVELLLLAQAAGYRIVEVPVNWADQPGGKVGVLRHGPGMLWQVARASRRVGRKGRTRRSG
jgi:dolichyl-phosphate beta-glucosyltransferase